MAWGKIEKWEWEEKYKKNGGHAMSTGTIHSSSGTKSDCPRCHGTGRHSFPIHLNGYSEISNIFCNCYMVDDTDWERTKKEWEYGKNHTELRIGTPAIAKKPPLDIIPEYYYERERILDLARAISNYARRDLPGEYMIKWVDELRERIIRWNKMEEHRNDNKKS